MRIVLIHQHDPAVRYVDGIGTFLRTFIQYAPPEFDLSLIGVTGDPQRFPLRRWQTLESDGRSYRFFPLLVSDTTRRRKIPLSLRFTHLLWHCRHSIDFRNAILEFHRIEPALALQALSNPKVLFLHSHSADLRNPLSEVAWSRFPGLYFSLERKLISRMRRIYIVREDAVTHYQNQYPALAERIYFLPTWVDGNVFSALPEPERLLWKERLAHEQGFNPADRLLLFAGRFEGQKDPLLLLEAFRHLNGNFNQTVLVLMGAGALEKNLRTRIQNQGLASRVRILGPQSQRDLAKWMNAADCLCLSSAFEGMPRVVVEALSCGLPVVGTDVGETKRLIASPAVGRLVKERTPEVFSRAIEDLFKQPRDSEACQRQVSSFTAEKILSPVYDFYRELNRRPQ